MRLLLGFLLLLSPLIASAENTDLEKQSFEIYGEIMSPYCPGRLLRDCPSGKATELKERIYKDLENGVEKEAIVSALVKNYGSSIIATPPTSGFSSLVWIAPAIFVLAGLGIISFFVSRSIGGDKLKKTKVAPKPDLTKNGATNKEIDDEIEKLIQS